MTDDAPHGKLPSTTRELQVYRKKAASKSVLERANALVEKTWGKHPKMHAVLTTRVFNGKTMEGTAIADKIAGAMYLREVALAEGDIELAELPLARVSNMIGVVLRRYDFTPLAVE